MYKVFIVDDEELVVKSLKASVDWKHCGFEVVGYALSAEEAVEKIPSHKPDVIFSDIRMPGMNGLELIKLLKDMEVMAKFIIVSGLAEFALAQKAIKHGVYGYCLKPFDEMEIMGYLLKIKKELETQNVLRDDEILDYIESSTAETSMKLEQVLNSAGIHRLEQDKLRLLLSVRRDKLSFDKSMPCLTIRIGHRKFIYLMSERDAGLFQASHRREELKGIGFSNAFTDIRAMIQAIQEAEPQAFQYFTISDSAAWRWNMRSTEMKAVIPNFTVDGSFNTYLARLDETLPLFRNGQYDIRHAILLYNECMMQLSRLGRDTTDLYLYSFDQLTDLYDDVDEMIAYLKGLFRDEQSGRNFQIQHGRNQTLTGILSYLNENFSEDVTIHAISKRFNVNANYISQLFRKELDRTFTEYMNVLRMERATVLLKTTAIPIHEIADQVGYKDYFYFSKLFKKMMGVPPKTYRNDEQS